MNLVISGSHGIRGKPFLQIKKPFKNGLSDFHYQLDHEFPSTLNPLFLTLSFGNHEIRENQCYFKYLGIYQVLENRN